MGTNLFVFKQLFSYLSMDLSMTFDMKDKLLIGLYLKSLVLVPFLINSFIIDIFQSLRNSLEVSDLLTRLVIVGNRISRFNLIKLFGKGSLLQYIVLVFLTIECTSSCVISIKVSSFTLKVSFRRVIQWVYV